MTCFFIDDEVAAGAYKALTEMKIKVPDDIALAGYGDLNIGCFMEVPLTTVSQSAVKIGQTASQMLLDKLSGNRALNENKKIVIPTKLIIRQSCGIRTNHTAVSSEKM